MKKFSRRPYKVKRKKSILKNKFFWLGISVLAVLGGTFYFLLLSAVFQVKSINISGQDKTPKSEIEGLVLKALDKKLLFFNSRSIFLTDFKKITKDILDSFPVISEAKLKKEMPDTITLAVTERKTAAVFCQNGNCFYMDKAGVIFENAPSDIQMLKVRYENLDFGGQINARPARNVVGEALLSSVLGIESKLKNDFGVSLKEAVIVSEDRVNLETFDGWKIYLNSKGDLDWQLSKLKTLLDKEIPQEKIKDLEYIDLRFGNSAPYKYR